MLVCMCVYVCVVVVTNGIGYYATLFRGTDSTRYAHKISFYTPHCSHNLCFFFANAVTFAHKLCSVRFFTARSGSFYLFDLLSYSSRMLCLSYKCKILFCCHGLEFRNFFLWCLSTIKSMEKKIDFNPNFICRSNAMWKFWKPDGKIGNI